MKLFSEELNIKYEFFAKTFESNISNIYNLIKPIKDNKLNNNNFQDKNTKYNSNEKKISDHLITSEKINSNLVFNGNN